MVILIHHTDYASIQAAQVLSLWKHLEARRRCGQVSAAVFELDGWTDDTLMMMMMMMMHEDDDFVTDGFISYHSVDGDVVKQPNAVARALAKSINPLMLGAGPVEQAQVRMR